MSMKTDVQASAVLAASGPFLNGAGQPVRRCRIKGIYGVNTGAGSLVITDGSSPVPVLTLTTPAGGTTMVEIPGEGILCAAGPSATLNGIATVTLFYG